MDWQTVRTWAMANLRVIFFIVGIILLLIFLIFAGETPDPNIPGGGFWTLVASGLLFWGSYKTSGTGSKVLGTIATILLVIWAWPRIFPFLNDWGLAPNLVMILAILAFIWMWKGGKGLFGWRMWLFIILVICWIGANELTYIKSKNSEQKNSTQVENNEEVEINKFQYGFNRFMKSTGIEFKMPDIEMPQFIKNTASGLSGYANNVSAQKASELKERVVKNGSTFYDHTKGGVFTKKEVSVNEEFIKVFLLGDSDRKDGLTFEKVRIGDPATGEDAWVYSGILLSSPTAEKPAATKSTAPEKAPEWELYKDFRECKFDFSGRGVFSNTVGPNGERANTGEVYSGCFLERGYEYKITFQGDYSKYFLDPPWYHHIPWRGWTPQNSGVELPYLQYQNMALILRIGNQEGIHPEGDLNYILISDMENSRIYGELNINRDYLEYYHPQIGSKIKNSTLTIEIRRRPLQR